MADDQQYGDGDYAGEDQQYEYNEGYGDDGYAQEQQDEAGGAEASNENGEGNNGDSKSGINKSDSEEERKLFVGGISWETEASDLKEYFSKFGEIVDVNIKTDPTTRKSRGFGFVTFASQEGVEAVLKDGPHTVKGKQVDPKRAKARPGIKKIFVGGLEPDIPEADIKAYFEKYGKVESIELPFDKMKNQRRQFCFITFETEEAVDEVCKQPKQKIGSKDCDIKKAAPKPDARSTRGALGFDGYGGSPDGGGRSRGRGGYGGQSWGQGYGGYNQGYGGYGQGYGGYNQGYGNYDYSGYGGGYGGGYGSYDYSGWGNYGQGGYDNNGQQQSGYGKSRRGGGGGGGNHGYHPYSR